MADDSEETAPKRARLVGPLVVAVVVPRRRSRLRPLVCDSFMRHYAKQTAHYASNPKVFMPMLISAKFPQSARRVLRNSALAVAFKSEESQQLNRKWQFAGISAHFYREAVGSAVFALLRAHTGAPIFRRLDVREEPLGLVQFDDAFLNALAGDERHTGVVELSLKPIFDESQTTMEGVLQRLGCHLKQLTCPWVYFKAIADTFTMRLDEFCNVHPQDGDTRANIELDVLLVHEIRRLNLTCGTQEPRFRWEADGTTLLHTANCPVQPAVEELVLELDPELDEEFVRVDYLHLMPNLKRIFFFARIDLKEKFLPGQALMHYLDDLHEFAEDILEERERIAEIIFDIQLATPQKLWFLTNDEAANIDGSPFEVIAANEFFEDKTTVLVDAPLPDEELRFLPCNQAEKKRTNDDEEPQVFCWAEPDEKIRMYFHHAK
ncbi:hypothetical protein M3Y99_01274800 [Aphelenchoides fujianensis]|nr:hypothetical protein M3Y99_01274800 [Aphelenchoides fujianensis]